MSTHVFARLLRYSVFCVVMITSGCGWFCAQYFPTTMPYAGTQTDLYVAKDKWNSVLFEEPEKSKTDETEPPVPRTVKLAGTLLGTVPLCIDIPFSFIADTFTLPAQLYYYLAYPDAKPELRYLQQKKAEERIAAEKRGSSQE